jgi:hypothetical protein
MWVTVLLINIGPSIVQLADSSSQEIFWLTSQTILHRFHYLLVGIEQLAFQVLYKLSKHVKITRGQV